MDMKMLTSKTEMKAKIWSKVKNNSLSFESRQPIEKFVFENVRWMLKMLLDFLLGMFSFLHLLDLQSYIFTGFKDLLILPSRMFKI